MTDPRMKRRELLLAAAAWAAALACGPRGPEFDVVLLESFYGLLGALHGCDAVGAAYLAHAPEEASPDVLAREVRARLEGGADPDALARAIASDFAEQRTVSLEGWVLSRTECRLCALARLAAS